MNSIPRAELIEELFNFSQEGSGIVIGKPGVGKSYCLSSLRSLYSERNLLAEIINVENLFDTSDESIGRELGYDQLGIVDPWLDVLSNIKVSDGKKALLIFDAFDAARNETLRTDVLNVIERALKLLSSKWNVIVSVRTYDAMKSPRLIKLFPIVGVAFDEIRCRKCLIPELSEVEVESALISNERLKNTYKKCTDELKSILRVPFFLNLFDKIHSSTFRDIDSITGFKSETQLLEAYWQIKIHVARSTNLESWLARFTHKLVIERRLSSSKHEIYLTLTPEDENSLEYLLKENLLEEVSFAKSRLAFAHNILFDFAVSILFLEADGKKLTAQIKEDGSRLFFLRPSFNYLATLMWYGDRKLFWNVFWMMVAEQSKEFRLLVRLILMGVVVSEFRVVEDVRPILNIAQGELRGEIVRILLQSIRFVRDESTSQDVRLFRELLYKLDSRFIWEYSLLLERTVKQKDLVPEEFELAGVCSRSLFGFILTERVGDSKIFLDRIGSSKGVELVCRTFETDRIESKNILTKVLEMLDEPGFQISYFYSLSENIKLLIPLDGEFVGKVYSVVFNYYETSNEVTPIGASPVGRFTSNRRQDYDLCKYILTETFPEFIRNSPVLALRCALEIVNVYVVREQGLWGVSKLREKEFEVRGIKCDLVEDMSSIWSENVMFHQTALMGVKVIDYLKEVIGGEGASAVAYLDEYIRASRVGFLWRALFQMGCELPEIIAKYFSEFYLIEVFYLSNDTVYDFARLLEVSSPFYDEQQIRSIEKYIVEADFGEDKISSNRLKVRFLSRIPREKLVEPASLELIEEVGNVDNKKSFVSFSQVTPYSDELWLKDQGVDVSDENIASVISRGGNLRQFNEQFLNETPQRVDFVSVFEEGYSLYLTVRKIRKGVGDKLVYSSLNAISQSFVIICKALDSLSNNEFKKLERVIRFCFNYKVESDLTIEANASPVIGFSPTPRITASEGLPFIYKRNASRLNSELLLSAISDISPYVRFSVCRNLNVIVSVSDRIYWRILFSRLPVESDPFIVAVLLGGVSLKGYKKSRFQRILRIAESRVEFFDSRNAYIEVYAELLLRLALAYEDAYASKILLGAFGKKQLCRTVIAKCLDNIQILSARHSDGNYKYLDKVSGWLGAYLEFIKNGVKMHPFETDHDILREEGKSEYLSLLNYIVERLYFVFESSGPVFANRLTLPNEIRKDVYFKLLPIIEGIFGIYREVSDRRVLAGHTAHYIMQILNTVVEFDPKRVLAFANEMTKYSVGSGYTFDGLAINEVVKLTEKLLADDRVLLLEDKPFNDLVELLDVYANSGWNEALVLLWRLDEVFR